LLSEIGAPDSVVSGPAVLSNCSLMAALSGCSRLYL
jgi:hypothetical protein